MQGNQAMVVKIYKVDAFTTKLFQGNQAAICILETWLDEKVMQNIAFENNYSETGFVLKKDDHYEIRYFSPQVEIALCGHATLAAAHVLFNYYIKESLQVAFITKNGCKLIATKIDDFIQLDFPKDKLSKLDISEQIKQSFDVEILEVYKGESDYLLLLDSEDRVATFKPDFNKISEIECRGIIITAKGETVDFVSRFFGPKVGILEDPVTGSAHTTLTQFWSDKLNKTTLIAKQLSKRTGLLKCTLTNDRVLISGQAIIFLIGEIYLH